MKSRYNAINAILKKKFSPPPWGRSEGRFAYYRATAFHIKKSPLRSTQRYQHSAVALELHATDYYGTKTHPFTRPFQARNISCRTAEVVLSELGFSLESFPNEKCFISYLNLAPKYAYSGGKPVRKKTKSGATNRVGQAFRQSATALYSSKTALGAEFRRISRKKGYGVAVFAMARRLATLVYRMLRWGQAYVDEGLEAYERRFEEKKFKACKTNAKSLGYKLLPIDPEEVLA